MTTMLNWYVLGLLHAAIIAVGAGLAYRIWKGRQSWTNAAHPEETPTRRTLSSYWSAFSSSSWLG